MSEEAVVQSWSDSLMELRQERQVALEKEQQEKSSSFAPSDFFNVSITSLDRVLEKWIVFQQKQWELSPPNDPQASAQQLREEADVIIDFELDALNRDLDQLKGEINWTDPMITEAEKSFTESVSEIRKKYQIKTAAFGNSAKKKPTPVPAAPPVMQIQYSSASNTSGVMMVVMFIVGLILGAAPSAYFWDVSRRVEKKFNTEKNKIVADKQLLEEEMTLLYEVFSQLASGKMKNLNDMENEMREVRSSLTLMKKKLENDYVQERERLMKKYPAGDKLDRALEDLEYKRVQNDSNLKTEQSTQLEKLESQKKRIQDLMSR